MPLSSVFGAWWLAFSRALRMTQVGPRNLHSSLFLGCSYMSTGANSTQLLTCMLEDDKLKEIISHGDILVVYDGVSPPSKAQISNLR